jgi:C4-dicarboxylate transporter
MYAAPYIILLVVYLLGSNAQYAVIDATSPMVSITFNLVMVRAGLSKEAESPIISPNMVFNSDP